MNEPYSPRSTIVTRATEKRLLGARTVTLPTGAVPVGFWTLTEIREGDGAQLYENPNAPPVSRTVWLCGIDRAPGVKVGERYRLVYVSDRRGGRYRVTP